MIENGIAFDLETIGNKSLIPMLPEVKPKGTLKDPVKIEADIADKKAKQIADLGLNPWTNIICAFGWCDGENAGHLILKDEESEKDLLYQIWDHLAKYSYFVTFNGIAFDVPVLNAHSLIHRIRTAVKINIKKYTIANHHDLRMILNNWDSHAHGTFDFFLKLFFGKGKAEGIDGSMVQEYWDAGRSAEIGENAERDGIDTAMLFDLVEKYYI